jgi:hypothetical protein
MDGSIAVSCNALCQNPAGDVYVMSLSLCVCMSGGLTLGLAAINISYKKGNTRKEIINSWSVHHLHM